MDSSSSIPSIKVTINHLHHRMDILTGSSQSHRFSKEFRQELERLMLLRRDVRRFQVDPIDPSILEEIRSAIFLAPSVGLSEPWRIVSVESAEKRLAIQEEFDRSNQIAAAHFHGLMQEKYRRLKLAGLREAPTQWAFFVDNATSQGKGLGRQTMPESLAYSVVAAIQNAWLVARALGVGIGWVSILEPERVAGILDAEASWQLVAYLCLGYPIETSIVPELQEQGWEMRQMRETIWKSV